MIPLPLLPPQPPQYVCAVCCHHLAVVDASSQDPQSAVTTFPTAKRCRPGPARSGSRACLRRRSTAHRAQQPAVEGAVLRTGETSVTSHWDLEFVWFASAATHQPRAAAHPAVNSWLVAPWHWQMEPAPRAQTRPLQKRPAPSVSAGISSMSAAVIWTWRQLLCFLLQSAPAAAQAMLPTRREFVTESEHFRVPLSRRLRMPPPFSPARARCLCV